MKFILAIIILLIGASVFMTHNTLKNQTYTYVITETTQPGMIQSNILDPLDADQTINMPVARMIYATPVVINLKGDLSSQILDVFEFDEKTNTIIWKLKSGIKYSNGAEMTADDVAFSVARMIHARPKFPVLEDVLGIEEWLNEKAPLKSLPKGISVDGQFIKISFNKKQDHPLFRFCLELFSIIPKSCVNLENSKIQCKEIPASGFYEIISKNKNEIIFNLRKNDHLQNLNMPEKIQFKYMTSNEAIKSLDSMDDTTILSGTDLQYAEDELNQFKTKLNMTTAPASRIVSLLINPEVAPFNDIKCRHVFADAFRTAFDKVANDIQLLEYSVFTDLLPGYLHKDELKLNSKIKFNNSDLESCKAQFKKYPVKWIKAQNNPNSVFVRVMEKVFEELDLPKSAPIEMETLSTAGDLFLKGEVSVVSFQTGFWAFDPAGDIQMLMTPNMHKALNFVSKDYTMQSLIKNLKQSGLDKNAFKKLNQQIYDEATFNVYTHIRRFVAAKNKSLISEAPLSITAPAPWQMFSVNNNAK